jgi:hypothetical protein
MKKAYKIYQTDFADHEHDCLAKLNNQDYITIKDAEIALQKYLDTSGDTGEFTILPVYAKKHL